jgi:D-tyrosyl-tRNA(Tyr) deacylase
VRVVVQRVARAEVRVGSERVGAVGQGYLALVGVEAGDGESDAEYIAGKIAGMRVFGDDQGKMNRSVADVGGGVLVVSQFTLLGDCRKGRRPSFTASASPQAAERLYLSVARRISERGIPVETGRFGAEMEIELVNDGPVTLLLDSKKAF